ncbi:hypothetical protein [Luteolibacter soli]|uniref:Uncharacterized protein n=1 Tax=Luteolibacter soli TaxID=3135280 RepID=A0ABU9AP62_9BACT
MKQPLPAGVLVMAIVGISAYAITALIAEANMWTGTIARTPMEAIWKSIALIKTERRVPDDITRGLALAGSQKPDEDRSPVEVPVLHRPADAEIRWTEPWTEKRKETFPGYPTRGAIFPGYPAGGETRADF